MLRKNHQCKHHDHYNLQEGKYIQHRGDNRMYSTYLRPNILQRCQLLRIHHIHHSKPNDIYREKCIDLKYLRKHNRRRGSKNLRYKHYYHHKGSEYIRKDFHFGYKDYKHRWYMRSNHHIQQYHIRIH